MQRGYFGVWRPTACPVRRGALRIDAAALLLFCLVTLSPWAAEAADASGAVLAQGTGPAPSGADAQKNSSWHPLAQAAYDSGARQCADTISKVVSYLTASTQSVGLAFFPATAPNEHLVSFSFELETQDAETRYASASFCPTPNNRCDAVYETVTYVDQSCSAMEKKLRKEGAKSSKVMHKYIIVVDAGDVKFFLMPAGSGCIVIKKEVVRQN